MIDISHYYGDIIRRLFLGAAALMLITLPFLQNFIPYPVFVSSLAVLILTLCAGLIAPERNWVIFLNVLASGAGVLVFEYYAVTSYSTDVWFFLTNQALAIIFLVAFYYAVKTARGALSNKP